MRPELRSVARALFALSLPASAWAAPAEHLDWGAAVNGAACPAGTLVINVVQKVVNSVDSGTTRPVWAFDDYVRQIQVVQVGPASFCATVAYQGSFTSVAGDSPGASYNLGGSVGGGVVGTFQGGYVSTAFTAILKATPDRRTKGSIAPDDHGCDASGSCPGALFWGDLYFEAGSVSGFDLAWWGWVYHAGNNGSWQNACPECGGNSGDITGN